LKSESFTKKILLRNRSIPWEQFLIFRTTTQCLKTNNCSGGRLCWGPS